MNYNFQHIDHWEFITPSEAVRYSGNELKAFIVNYFNKYHYLLKGEDATKLENLLFSLVEVITVNINDLKGVGDTFIYSNNPESEVNQTFSKYHQLLEDIKNSGKKYITEYSNWYKNEAFLLMLSNNTSVINSNHKDTYYRWHSIGISSSNEKIEAISEDLDDEKIIEYLHEYAGTVIPILNLDKYPYSFILIKPVSLIDPLQKTKPVGNFFFHIALKESVSEAQIVNFLNLFVLTWIKKYWSTVFEKLRLKNISEVLEIDAAFYKYKLDKISTASNIYGDKSMNDFVVEFFTEDVNNGKSFQSELHDVIYPEIVESLYHIKIKRQRSLTFFSSYIYTTNRESFKSTGYNSDLVRHFVITHLIIKTGILVFDLHLAQIVDIIRDINQFIEKYMQYSEWTDTATNDSLKHYLQRDRLIYLGSADPSKRTKINQNLISSLSCFEAYTFLTGKEKIARILDTEDDEVSQTVLRNATALIDKIISEKLGSSYPNLYKSEV